MKLMLQTLVFCFCVPAAASALSVTADAVITGSSDPSVIPTGIALELAWEISEVSQSFVTLGNADLAQYDAPGTLEASFLGGTQSGIVFAVVASSGPSQVVIQTELDVLTMDRLFVSLDRSGAGDLNSFQGAFSDLTGTGTGGLTIAAPSPVILGFTISNAVAVIPEPATATLLVTGLALLAGRGRRAHWSPRP